MGCKCSSVFVFTDLVYNTGMLYLGVSGLQREAGHLFAQSGEENLAVIPLQSTQQLQMIHSRADGLWAKQDTLILR